MRSELTRFLGLVITNSMMGGVGIILAKVGVDMVKRNYSIGLISVIAALLTYYITPDPNNKLVYTIVISVVVSTIVSMLLKEKIKALPLVPLKGMIEGLKEKDYEFKTVNELIVNRSEG